MSSSREWPSGFRKSRREKARRWPMRKRYAAGLLLVAACGSPGYRPSPAPVAREYAVGDSLLATGATGRTGETGIGMADTAGTAWKSLNDSTLDRLMDLALRSNF